MNTYRHGDLSFHPINETEGEEIKHNGSFALALGEHTGHSHVISVENPSSMRIFKDSEGRYVLELKEGGSLVHEEHKKITFAPGKYRMMIEREFDYFLNEVAKVQD